MFKNLIEKITGPKTGDLISIETQNGVTKKTYKFL